MSAYTWHEWHDDRCTLCGETNDKSWFCKENKK